VIVEKVAPHETIVNKEKLKMSTNKNKSTSTYTKEFQQNAVRLALNGEKSKAAVARELGIPEWKLRDWVRATMQASVKNGSKSALDDLLALQQENKKLRMENEILKKAATYFAKNLT
jgi:transposase-like protein